MTEPGQSEGSLIAMAGISVTEQDLDKTLRQILELACSALPGGDEGGITLLEAEGPRTAIATGDAALQVDRSQYAAATGGPCLEAYRRQQILRIDSGRTQQPVRFTGYEPVSPQAAQRWKTTCGYVRDTVLAMPESTGQSLVTASAARLIIATALAVFPNNAFTDPTIEDRHDAHPATLRRAMAFIDEHAYRDITVADMIAADPAHDSVTAVAYRGGFPSPSRFAARYRQAYGVLPSHTLHN